MRNLLVGLWGCMALAALAGGCQYHDDICDEEDLEDWEDGEHDPRCCYRHDHGSGGRGSGGRATGGSGNGTGGGQHAGGAGAGTGGAAESGGAPGTGGAASSGGAPPLTPCDEETDCEPGTNCDLDEGICKPGDAETCGELMTAVACANRNDCKPIYAGTNCSCGADCQCQGGEPGCICQNFEFFRCIPLE